MALEKGNTSVESRATEPACAAVILAAGKGTRMKSERAKVLHELCGRPLVAFPIDIARQAGASPCIIVVGHQADAVRASIASHFPDEPIRFAEQREQRGTGDAVRAAVDALRNGPEDVLVLSGDVPLVRAETLRHLVQARRSAQAAVALAGIRPASPTGYGRLVRDDDGRLTRIVEEKDATSAERAIGEVNAGIYCFERDFLLAGLGELEPKNAQGEYYLTDLVALASSRGKPVVTVEADADEAAGINDRAELARLEAVLRKRRNDDTMRAGVTMRDPATVWIDYGVTLGRDVEIEPCVSLLGRTRIADGARIGQGCVVIDSEIGPGVQLKPYSHVEGAVVGAEGRIGPFARLRPGTELANDVHIGNFVETKKARIGERSKANHLAYLGDAVIGKDCNVGAGTITCNYDGANKHETRLGDGVFIGSDSQLVAPVTLADGAYVGAGTTVTRDVPADTLVVTRAPATTRPDWAKRRREKLAKKNGGTSASSKPSGDGAARENANDPADRATSSDQAGEHASG